MKQELLQKAPVVARLAAGEECLWCNPRLLPAKEAFSTLSCGAADVAEASDRLARFASYLAKAFPETAENGGLIESPLRPLPHLALRMEREGGRLPGRVFLKQDSDLAVAGSVKARGGIHEVLKHAEELALADTIREDYSLLLSPAARSFFSRYQIQVGSTGNLGLSIGIMSAALGFRVTVHMSADARQWKKDLLRQKGVEVVEYAGDYSLAVEQGRAASDADPMSYFVDDENSSALFFGYAVAAERLKDQLTVQGITVDEDHPLFVTVPCGVGGAPGGITFGLKLLFGDHVHVFFAEPTQCPSMLLGLATGLDDGVCVQDVGISGETHADGLAVGRPSKFVGKQIRNLLSGIFTVKDARLYDWMRKLLDEEGLFIEPSACACLPAPVILADSPEFRQYLEKHSLSGRLENACHILWATGGRLVPEEIRQTYRETVLE